MSRQAESKARIALDESRVHKGSWHVLVALCVT